MAEREEANPEAEAPIDVSAEPREVLQQIMVRNLGKGGNANACVAAAKALLEVDRASVSSTWKIPREKLIDALAGNDPARRAAAELLIRRDTFDEPPAQSQERG